jgi:glycosyltransferase involved in cell wall biosynthesis
VINERPSSLEYSRRGKPVEGVSLGASQAPRPSGCSSTGGGRLSSEPCDGTATNGEALPNTQAQFSNSDNCVGGGSPLVSIITCVYNAGKYLRPSILSIVSQTYRNLDIIIVDDGSTDGCMDTISDMLHDRRIRVFRQANATRPVALNRALDRVQGEYYAIQDADDISNPTRIQKQLEAIAPRPSLAAVFCGYRLVMNGKSMAPQLTSKSETECKTDIDAFRIPAHDATGLFRMSIVRDMRYDPSLPFVEAYDYILRMGENYPMAVLGDCLYGYRMHPSSLTQSDPDRRNRMVTKMLERACERRGLPYSGALPQGGRDKKHRSRNRIMDNDIASVFVISVLGQRQTGRWWGPVRTGLQCARLHPLDPYYYKALVYALAPARCLRIIRSAKGLRELSRLRTFRPHCVP